MQKSQTDHTNQRKAFAHLFRARIPLVLIDTTEESYAMGCLVAASVDEDRQVLTWSAVKGVSEGLFAEEHQAQSETLLPAAGMRYLAMGTGSRIMVLFDLITHLDDAVNVRCLRELVEKARTDGATVVLINDGGELPSALSAVAVPHPVPLPDRAELKVQMQKLLTSLRDHDNVQLRISNDHFEEMIDHLTGLNRQQAEQVVRMFCLDDKRLDIPEIDRMAEHKRAMMCSGGILNLARPKGGMETVAGFKNLKAWLERREKGKAQGLPPARGILLLGVPGSGKSLCSKAIAASWKRPLLHLDAGALYDKYIGESERRLRSSLHQAESMAPCVLWIDEIEKAFASAAGRSSDGGLSQRMFGTLLNWMQEHRSDIFLIATANDIEALPPELLRKGRFDEIFFADLPDAETRAAIIELHAKLQNIDASSFDVNALASECGGFSGAEIEQAIIAARYDSTDGTVSEEMIAAAMRNSPPLSKTAAEGLTKLRQWAAGRCVIA